MTVYRKNISINVGETFSEDLTLLSADGTGVVDLTGFTAQSQLRKHPIKSSICRYSSWYYKCWCSRFN